MNDYNEMQNGINMDVEITSNYCKSLRDLVRANIGSVFTGGPSWHTPPGNKIPPT